MADIEISVRPDILGLCETFPNHSIIDSKGAIGGYDRKDRIDTQNETGDGLILYIRNWIKNSNISLNIKFPNCN